ncbi:MAG TPA: hypothetical protein VLT87_22815 [Thermoanaerobaculia bacterium]|nr:hypothetical protein [Thermoanaerobaculia bacterium]
MFQAYASSKACVYRPVRCRAPRSSARWASGAKRSGCTGPIQVIASAFART